MYCFEKFLKNGLSSKEYMTINSIKKSIESFFGYFSGSISKYKDGWKDTCAKDSDTNELHFSVHKFCAQTAQLLEFQKEFCKTQLIASYFEEQKIHNSNVEHQAAQKIANWVCYRKRKSKFSTLFKISP